MEITCSNGVCAFRVDDRYFRDKPRFTPGICPNCNSPVQVVETHTTQRVTGAHVDTDPASQTYREVILE